MVLFITLFQNGAACSIRGKIPPVYMVFNALCFNPHVNFAGLASVY